MLIRSSPARLRNRTWMTAVLLLAALCCFAASARADDLYVDPGNPECSDQVSVLVASSAATPWCSPLPATRLTRPGDVVHLAAATYATQVRPAVSGTPALPIVYQADGIVTIAPRDASVGVMLSSVHDLVVRGVSVLANAAQGIAIDNAQNITLDRDTVTNRGGSGVWIKHGSAITVSRCALVGNARAGLFDSLYAVGTTLSDSTITANGIDGQQYGGDGVDLNGTDEVARGDTISGNGDGTGFEHGIYIGATAARYSITGNRIGGNAGADIKATGGPGVIAYNYLDSGFWGLVFSDNTTLVTVEYNLVQGSFQHGIFLTTGATPARVRLLNNTVEQTGRWSASGDASAVFVASASDLVMRNNLLSYTNPDALGSALFVNNASLLAHLDSQSNWFSSTDGRGRTLAWNGSRVTIADWRRLSSHDVASISSAPPAFDASGRVASGNLGAGAGTWIGLKRDLVGTLLPVDGAPDIGAYQSLG
jgi:nitrous oxidase accessory protein NosD